MRFHTVVLKNIFRRRVRSTLTMTGMAVAVGSLVALVGSSSGFSRTVLGLYEKRNVALIVSRSDAVNPLTATIDERLGKEIADLEGVQAVCPGLVDVISLEKLGLNTVPMQGWPVGAYMFDELEIREGEKITQASRGQKHVMLGKDLARATGLKVGGTVEMVDEPFRIIGVFETFAGLENNMLIMLLEDAQKLQGKPKQITGCTVKLSDPSPQSVERVKAIIEGEIAEKLRLKGKLRARPPAEYVQDNKQLLAFKAMAWVTSIVALLMGAIGMLNTMVMSVFERTREIGILRAIGWRPGRVMRMILLESVLLSVAGGIVGTFAAIGLIALLNRLPWVNGMIQDAITLDIVLKGFLIAIAVGLIGAAYPAFRGARLLPTEAIRHE